MVINKKISTLINNIKLPDANDLGLNRFFTKYEDRSALWSGIQQLFMVPIYGVSNAWEYALNSVWEAFKAICNFLILQPRNGIQAAEFALTSLIEAIELLLMAPIYVLTLSLELLTRSLTSWFSRKHDDALTKSSYGQFFIETFDNFKQFFPTAAYFTKANFFSSHSNLKSFLSSLADIANIFISCVCLSLCEAFRAVYKVIECVSDLLILRPHHAWDNFRFMTVHLALSLSLALMAVYNTAVKGIAVNVTRLGSTWISPCCNENTAPLPLSLT